MLQHICARQTARKATKYAPLLLQKLRKNKIKTCKLILPRTTRERHLASAPTALRGSDELHLAAKGT